MPVNVYPAPWYKEKLPSKCFQKQASNKEKFSDSLNAQRWKFLKNGLDDFRSGCPPPLDNIIIQGTKGPTPIILQYKKLDASQIVPYKSRDLLSKRKVLHSRLPTPQKAKADNITQTKHTQVQHPLALYPHLEESVPPELFDDVMKLLDPGMQLTRTSPDYSKEDAAIPSPSQYRVKYDVPPKRSYSSTLPWMHKKKNPYTWFSKKEVAQRQQAAKIDYVPPLDENVKRVTKEFCEWVNAMGGEKYNIDEDTIMKLFDTRYETDIKTALPLKIVELYQIPAELRQYLGRHRFRKRAPTKLTPSEPKWEKIKYGAWYLPPKTWKKKRATEKEEIPECLQIFLNARKKIVQKAEAELESPLHGTYAFEQFLERKGYRKPQFLLQMLAAGHSDKIAEDSELLSRKLSMKILQEFRSQSSATI
ncbi:protein FAM47E-like [Protobothrops mucrosquamatus]|uniref:protein FAM47E-like n=1 Tax=Protobothrops mucrosquamatus TaxID=103944 RepID=UPI0010FB20A1|nr:protein FAM47E-like [Protobothrops mucrosquamatus]